MRRAFSLIEVMFASGVAAIGLLTLLGALLSVRRASLKSADSERAAAMADQVIERTILEVARRDNDAFWAQADGSLWKEEQSGEFHCKVTSDQVMAREGGALGMSTGASDNTLRRIYVTVWWWSPESTSRQGYGNLKVTASRLINRTRIDL